MAAKPLTTEAIALTEKKMDMTLDDIIKMSKNPSTNKPKNQQRTSNRSEKSLNTVPLNKSAQVQYYMNSRSSLRQAALAQRRSNFQQNQFPLAAGHARKVLVTPTNSRPFNYHGRAWNPNAPRVGTAPVKKVLHGGGFILKKPVQQQVKVLPKQRPRTLDSLFANMKEKRMGVLSQQNTAGRRIVGGQQRQQWGRGRFGN